MLDFRIDTFLTVCEYMNYTRAAEALCITQPAVSQHIRWLENQYGVPLFRYTGHHLTLTPAGEALRRVASTMKQDALSLRRQLNLAEEAAGALCFGATPTVSTYLLPAPLAAYHKDHPGAPIALRVSNTQRLCEMLDAGEIDFAIVEGYFYKGDYDALLCCHERYLPVCTPGYSFSAPPARLTDLLREPLLVREQGSGSREIIRRSLNRQNMDLEDFACKIEIGDMNVLKQLLLQGCGIAFLYESAVRQELNAGTLREIPLEDFDESHDIAFLWRKGSVFAPQFRQLHPRVFPEAPA